jgi:hypothetical protein
MPATTAQRKGRTVGRKRTPPDPTSQEWHVKLARLVDRKRKGRTNAEIAQTAGMTPTFFGQVLNGRKSPNFVSLTRILEVLPASLTDLDRA